eukprot:3672750-Rhodomonas_salina.4
MSGAQRVHDVPLLVKQCQDKQIPANDLKAYVDAFRYGAFPHAGGGIGLEVPPFLSKPLVRSVVGSVSKLFLSGVWFQRKLFSAPLAFAKASRAHAMCTHAARQVSLRQGLTRACACVRVC